MERVDSAETLKPPQLREAFTPPPQQETKMDDIAVPANSANYTTDSPRSAKRMRQKHESQSIGAMLRRGIVEHQLGLSVNIMLLVALSYILFPSLRDRASAFFWLSYPSSVQRGMYGLGPRDLYPVASFIVLFTAVRAFCLDHVLMPLAGWCGIAKTKGRVRFAEQSYMMVYYAMYWFWGLSLFVRNTPPDVKNVGDLLESLYAGYPHLYVGPGMKVFYLSQLAFWIQQIVVIHIEEKRKDHYQMLTHHIITVSLLSFSYPYRQWRVGNAILVCMDIVDLVLPLAKVLRYLGLQTACDAAFALFVVIWLAARHIAYLAVCWSIPARVGFVTMPYGLYSTETGAKLSSDGGTNVLDNLLQPMLHPYAKTVSFNANIRNFFLGLLLVLQCITIAWFVLICRVVMRVIRGQGADDSRSDAEDGEGEIVDENGDIPAPPSSSPYTLNEVVKPKFIEVETTSDDYPTYLRRKGSASKRRSKVISSGLSLGEHKEILNRIGCLSEEQLAREREKREGSASPRPGSGRK